MYVCMHIYVCMYVYLTVYMYISVLIYVHFSTCGQVLQAVQEQQNHQCLTILRFV